MKTMYPPNIVGVYFLLAMLMGMMTGMALWDVIRDWRERRKRR